MRKATTLEPRNSCGGYVSKNGGQAWLITKENFNQLVRDGKFADGPYEESQPGTRQRQVFGKLENGDAVVYCELHKTLQRRVKEKIAAEKERAVQRRNSVTDVAIDLSIDDDILAPCIVKTERDGKEYLEQGYKFASKDAEDFARRIVVGGGLI